MRNKILIYNMNIFECTDIRKIIFSYIYPVIITKGMTLKVIDSKFHKYMIGNTYEIFKITRMGKHTVVVIEKKGFSPDNHSYTVYSYLFPNGDDLLKIIHFF